MKKALIFFLLSLLLFSFFIPLIDLPAAQADGENWLTGWSYRREITIPQLTGADVNYTINVYASNNAYEYVEFSGNSNFQTRWMQPSNIYSSVTNCTYVSYITKDALYNVSVVVFNHTSLSWGSPVVVIEDCGNADVPRPAMNLDSNGYFYLFACPAGVITGCQMDFFKSDNPYDISSWTNKTSTLSGVSSVRTPMIQIDSSDNLYLFFTNKTAANTGQEVLFKSDDGGDSWSNPVGTDLIDFGGTSEVWAGYTWMNDDVLYIIYGSDNLTGEYLRDAYFLKSYDEGSTWKTADNSSISPPAGYGTGLIQNTGAYRTETNDIKLDSSGNPNVLYAVSNASSSGYMLWRYAVWNGASWDVYNTGISSNKREGGAAEYYQEAWGYIHEITSDYIKLALDITDPDALLAYVSADGGSTWDFNQTLFSLGDYWSCNEVLNHPTSGSHIDYIGGKLSTSGLFAIGVSLGAQTYSDNVVLCNHAKSDGSDIRFTSSDGSTLLSYWMETEIIYLDGFSFWIRIPENLTDAGTTIYIYYGNPSASSIASAEDTFQFFDTFDGSGLDPAKWENHTSGVGSVSVSGGALIVNSNASASLSYGNAFSIDTFPLNHSAVMAVSTDSGLIANKYRLWGYSDSSINHYAIFDTISNSYLKPICKYTSTTYGDTLATPAANKIYKYEVRRESNNASFYYPTNTYGTSITTNVPSDSLPIGFQDAQTASPTSTWTSIYWCFDRAWIPSEPLFAVGNEEQMEIVTFSDYGCSTTAYGETTILSVYCSIDLNSLSGFIFEWNASGAAENNTWSSLSGSAAWANTSKTLSYNIGTVVSWRIYVNSTAGFWHTSDSQTFTITGTITFYFNEGGTLERNGTGVSNGTATEYSSADTLILEGIPDENYVHWNFTWDSGSSAENPLTYITNTTETIWCYFMFYDDDINWDSVSVSGNKYSTAVNFTLIISSGESPSGCIFGSNNSGIFENDTWAANPELIFNVEKTLNDTKLNVVEFQIWFNSSFAVWNNTGSQYLTIHGYNASFLIGTDGQLEINSTLYSGSQNFTDQDYETVYSFQAFPNGGQSFSGYTINEDPVVLNPTSITLDDDYTVQCSWASSGGASRGEFLAAAAVVILIFGIGALLILVVLLRRR